MKFSLIEMKPIFFHAKEPIFSLKKNLRSMYGSWEVGKCSCQFILLFVSSDFAKFCFFLILDRPSFSLFFYLKMSRYGAWRVFHKDIKNHCRIDFVGEASFAVHQRGLWRLLNFHSDITRKIYYFFQLQ